MVLRFRQQPFSIQLIEIIESSRSLNETRKESTSMHFSDTKEKLFGSILDRTGCRWCTGVVLRVEVPSPLSMARHRK